MDKPITLCDRCDNVMRCLLNYDGVACRRTRTVEPTNADKLRAMTDEELAEMHTGVGCPPGTDLNELCLDENGEELLCTPSRCRECWLEWLRQEAEPGAKL